MSTEFSFKLGSLLVMVDNLLEEASHSEQCFVSDEEIDRIKCLIYDVKKKFFESQKDSK